MKHARVIWSNEALNDLEMIYDFLADYSQPAAQQIIENILNKTKQLESFPESGAIQESISTGKKKYRYLIEGNYKMIYRYQSEKQMVSILVIFDTRLNPEKLSV